MHLFTCIFPCMLLIDERVIVLSSWMFRSFQLSFVRFQFVCIFRLSSNLLVGHCITLLMSPFLPQVKEIILMNRRFITPIKMGYRCQVIIHIVFKFLLIIYGIFLNLKQFLKLGSNQLNLRLQFLNLLIKLLFNFNFK